MTEAGLDRCAYSGGWSTGVEVVELELFTPEVTFGAHLLIALWPKARAAWYWAAIIEADERVVSVSEAEIPLPRPAAGWQLRASGLWTEAVCEEPFEHWSYGLEAFALRYDEPGDAVTHQRGERVPLGYELEWEADGNPAVGVDTVGPAGEREYRQGGVVHGEVLVGEVLYDVSGFGSRLHRVGASWPERDHGSSWRDVGASWRYRDEPGDRTAVGRSLTRFTPPVGPVSAVVAERTLWRGEGGIGGWNRGSSVEPGTGAAATSG